MVVGPRYNPAPVVQSVDFRPDGGGWGASKSDPVPDRDRISPVVLDPATNAPVNPTSITVRLQAGFPLGEVKSHHHAIKTESPDASTRIIRLAEGVGAGGPRFRADLEACGGEGAVGRPVPRTCRRQRLSARLRHPAFGRAGREEAAAARGDLRDRQFRLDGRRLDHPGQGQLDLCARPSATRRPLQRDPLRSHHGRAVPDTGAGRPRASRPGHLVRRRAAGQWRHRNGAGDARGAQRYDRRRQPTTFARSCS